MKNKFIATLTTLVALISAPAVLAAGGGEDQKILDYDWSFEGPFGKFDQLQLQRGLQVFTEVCSACHGIKQVGFYSLAEKGAPLYILDDHGKVDDKQARAYAKGFTVWDEKLREEREANFSDRFPAVTAVNAPDLSLMAKARAGYHGPYGLGINQIIKGPGGPEYIRSVLLGYTGKQIEEFGSVFYENEAFPGNKIGMAPPLSDGVVSYIDGSPETAEQYAADVTAFLMWTAEPKLNDRKMMGMVSVLMLGLLTVLLYLSNKALWYNVKHKDEDE